MDMSAAPQPAKLKFTLFHSFNTLSTNQLKAVPQGLLGSLAKALARRVRLPTSSS